MVKIVVSFSLIVSFLFGDVIDDKIKSFVGNKRFYSSKKIINILLGDKKQYFKDGNRVDIIKLLRVLKKNGFIKQDLKSVKNVEITFSTQSNSLLFLRVLESVLNSMGFNFYITKKVYKDGKNFSWTIVMNTEYLIDPVVFADELKKYNCFIDDIKKIKDGKWHYFISSNEAFLPVKRLVSEVTYKLKKPIKSYWLEVDEDANIIHIISYRLNRWHPYITFLDRRLKILSVYDSEDIVKDIKLNIPKRTKYIILGDRYTIGNIRSGLKVYLQKDR